MGVTWVSPFLDWVRVLRFFYWWVVQEITIVARSLIAQSEIWLNCVLSWWQVGIIGDRAAVQSVMLYFFRFVLARYFWQYCLPMLIHVLLELTFKRLLNWFRWRWIQRLLVYRSDYVLHLFQSWATFLSCGIIWRYVVWLYCFLMLLRSVVDIWLLLLYWLDRGAYVQQ